MDWVSAVSEIPFIESTWRRTELERVEQSPELRVHTIFIPVKRIRNLADHKLICMGTRIVPTFWDGMAKDARAEFETGLNSFAVRAAQAWELSSIFYMSALLYPEDYREGDLNDLELFIDRLRIKYLS